MSRCNLRNLTLMLLACLFALLTPASSAKFHRRGNQTTIAPNWNFTTPSPSSVTPSTVTPVELTTPLPISTRIEVPKYPLPGTGAPSHRPFPTGSSPHPANYSGPSCTVNVPHGTIAWWYAATYTWPVATLMAMPGSLNDTELHYTSVPSQDSFNVTSALADYAYTTTVEFDDYYNMTFTYLMDYTVKPTAAATSVITRSAYSPLPSGTTVAEHELVSHFTDPAVLPAASFGVGLANSTVPVATSATPVAYFSAYEVESAVPFTANNGAVTVSTVTHTFALLKPYAYPFSMKNMESTASASGTVPYEFIQQIPQATCAPGTLSGSVTVLVVLDLIYRQMRIAAPMKVHIEESVLGWNDPGPQTDVPINVKTKGAPQDPFNSARVEVPVDGFQSSDVVPTMMPDVVQSPSPSPAPVLNVPAPTPTTVGSIGSVPVVIGPSSVVVVGSETLKPGQQITVGGNPVSLDPSGSNIVVGTQTSALPVVPVGPAPPIITIGQSTLTPNAATQFSLGPGQILTPGGQATLDGTVISLAPSASFLVVGGSTQMLPPALPAVTPPPTIVLGQSTFTQLPGSSFIIGSQTLAIGQPITVDSTTLSLGPSFIIINTATSTFANSPLLTPRPALTLASTTLVANSNGAFVLDGQTLSIAGPPLTISGTTLSLASSNILLINGIPSTLNIIPAPITPPPLTIGSSILTPLPGPGTSYALGTLLLTPGGTITSGSLTISLSPDATALIINGITTTLLPAVSAPLITNPPLLTLGADTFTANPGTSYTIHGQVLTPGGAVTFDGTTVSLSPGATQMIVESAGGRATSTLFPAPATTTGASSVTRAAQASAGPSVGAGGAKATGRTKGSGSGIRSSPTFGWGLFAVLLAVVV